MELSGYQRSLLEIGKMELCGGHTSVLSQYFYDKWFITFRGRFEVGQPGFWPPTLFEKSQIAHLSNKPYTLFFLLFYSKIFQKLSKRTLRHLRRCKHVWKDHFCAHKWAIFLDFWRFQRRKLGHVSISNPPPPPLVGHLLKAPPDIRVRVWSQKNCRQKGEEECRL